MEKIHKRRIFTAEHRRNLSEAGKGKIFTIEHRRNLSEAGKGKHPSEATLKKMSEAHKNPSKETRRKMREAHKGVKNHSYGKHISEEQKRKISEANKGRIVSEEQKRKQSKAMKGRKFTIEHKRKIGLALKNPSEETRRKMREANIGEKNNMYGRTGEKNSNWQGGLSFEPYTKEFNNKFKRSIRKRDEYVCMLCGVKAHKLKRALCVHHINYIKTETCKENCISLCNSCNVMVNKNRKHWVNFFQGMLFKKYNYFYINNKIILKTQEEEEKEIF